MSLPDVFRIPVTLFYLEQKAYEEVAMMLGIPLGTVKTLLFRAKKELVKIGNRQARVIPVERSFSPAGPAQNPVRPVVIDLTGAPSLTTLNLI